MWAARPPDKREAGQSRLGIRYPAWRIRGDWRVVRDRPDRHCLRAFAKATSLFCERS
jgi:hypothetical protein